MTDRPEAPKSAKGRHNGKDPARVAVISLHTSPRDQPGSGDSGGMNVYVLSVARRLAEQGIAVDIYTRCHGQGGPDVEEIAPGTHLVNVQAGPCAPVAKDDLPRLLPEFLDGVLQHARAEDPTSHRHSPYDVVHSHYWLSGWVGSQAKQIWGVPLVASFHTLGEVKNSVLPKGDRPEPPARLAGERGVIAGADRILAPTPLEADHLVNLYGADRERIRVVPPGVDGRLFAPRPKDEARARLHLANARLLLFVGRLQPFKGPEVAIRALAEAVARAPEAAGDVILAVVGGSTGRDAEHDQATRLMELAADIGVSDRVVFFPPQPHERLADFYSAAEAVLVPSRSESFGLAALEAEACGTPVIAAAAGGLRYVVIDGKTGFLIEGHDPGDYADRILRILSDPVLAARLSKGALRHAGGFSWDATAADIRRVYRELLARRGA
ncbi:MAG: D-inositol-3-phosphate glycosyltransferase [Actinobacteria bacterium]|nr:MAG: D-inositol-3-phosphate glycosyltransferase [Actinomycetota bacterium]